MADRRIVSVAIANAVANALGIRLTRLPLTPEKILDALAAKRSEEEKR